MGAPRGLRGSDSEVKVAVEAQMKLMCGLERRELKSGCPELGCEADVEKSTGNANS